MIVKYFPPQLKRPEFGEFGINVSL